MFSPVFAAFLEEHVIFVLRLICLVDFDGQVTSYFYKLFSLKSMITKSRGQGLKSKDFWDKSVMNFAGCPHLLRFYTSIIRTRTCFVSR